MKALRSGFTLIELLVVIVILGILSTASIGAYSHFFEQARKKNATEVCDQIKTAWTNYHRDLGFWPDAVGKSGVQEMDTEMCEILGKAKLLDVLYIDDNSANAASGLKRNREKDSELKYGMLDPIGQKLFDRGVTGSRVTDHLYQFVIDQNEDGIVDGSDGMPAELTRGRTIRADVAVWCWPEDEEARKDGETYAQSW